VFSFSSKKKAVGARREVRRGDSPSTPHRRENHSAEGGKRFPDQKKKKTQQRRRRKRGGKEAMADESKAGEGEKARKKLLEQYCKGKLLSRRRRIKNGRI